MSKESPKVFIIEHPRHRVDVSVAEAFGEIVYVFGPNDRRCSVFAHERFGALILDILKKHNFDQDHDSVCVVGAVVMLATAITTIAQNYDKLNLLLFNSVDNSYVKKCFIKPNETERAHGQQN